MRRREVNDSMLRARSGVVESPCVYCTNENLNFVASFFCIFFYYWDMNYLGREDDRIGGVVPPAVLAKSHPGTANADEHSYEV